MQQNENLLSCFEIEQLIDLNIQALKCDLDKDSYNILLNSFSVFPMFVQRQVLEKMQQLDLEREVLQKNFVFPLLEKISVIIQELIQKEGEQGLLFSSSACYKHEKDSDELFLFSLSSDGGAVSNIAMLNACLDFIVALLSKAQNPQQLVEEKLVFIVNEFTKYLKESYSGPNELLMNTFAEWMSHLIDMIFERMDLENLALTSYSVNIQEMIIRVAISPLPLTATELNIRAFRHWLHLLSEPNKISRSLFSFRIVDNMTEELVDILAAAFDIACNDIDHRVRVAAFQVVVQALLLNDFPAYEIGMDMNQVCCFLLHGVTLKN